MPLPTLSEHSRWELIEETAPGFFRVRYTCDLKIGKLLARRYVRSESLSYECLMKEKARAQGKRNLSRLRIGYQHYVRSINLGSSTSKYSTKLSALEAVINLKQQGLSNPEIADSYGSTRQAVQKRLSKSASKLQIS